MVRLDGLVRRLGDRSLVMGLLGEFACLVFCCAAVGLQYSPSFYTSFLEVWPGIWAGEKYGGGYEECNADEFVFVERTSTQMGRSVRRFMKRLGKRKSRWET